MTNCQQSENCARHHAISHLGYDPPAQMPTGCTSNGISDATALSWHCRGDALAMLWPCYGDVRVHGNSIACHVLVPLAPRRGCAGQTFANVLGFHVCEAFFHIIPIPWARYLCSAVLCIHFALLCMCVTLASYCFSHTFCICLRCVVLVLRYLCMDFTFVLDWSWQCHDNGMHRHCPCPRHGVPRHFYGNEIAFPRHTYEQMQGYGNDIDLPWRCHGIVTAMRSHCHGMPRLRSSSSNTLLCQMDVR